MGLQLKLPRVRRLREELLEAGLSVDGSESFRAMLLEEVDLALRPPIHERREPSIGVILDPQADPESWASESQLQVGRKTIVPEMLPAWRRYCDGLSSWLLRRSEGLPEWIIFDRPAGSERDLVVLAEAFNATVVQRNPGGIVRIAGGFGVLRWEGISWHYEPPVSRWIDILRDGDSDFKGDVEVLEEMLLMAVHDLGSRGIGALLVYRPGADPGPPVEERLPTPPPLKIRSAAHIAPLVHALSHVDGAAVFDDSGVLRNLGVFLAPSRRSATEIGAIGGTRHTAGLRYSRDDPAAWVVVVSEDGPVSLLHDGVVVARDVG